MKQVAFRAKWCLAILLVVMSQMSCQPASPDTNRAQSDAETNRNAEPEPINTTAIESELLRIERDWSRVFRKKDVEAVRRIEADDSIFVYPDGNLGNKEQDLKDTEAGALSAESWEVTDLKVNVLNADAAIVSGRTIVTGGKYKRPDGKTVNISGQYRFIDTFVRREGRWQLVAGAAVPVQEPPAASAASPSAKKEPTPPPPASTPKSTY